MWRKPSTFFQLFLAAFGVLALGGCGTFFFSPLQTHPARQGEKSALAQNLKNLPEPKEPVIVAVYQFRDQTGQYKPTEGGGSFSTAVTQGAGNILVRVLQDSKWFVPIERENISDLLNERKIIRSTRQQFGLNEELPALLYAGVLLEGGIISYDANVITGGAGLRYFGTGGSGQYRQDRVTVYLRATSVSNGKILKTVYASKMILSQSVDGGMFRFVKFKRLLEAETGFTFNEPSEMAVTEAIEKAVETMIYEGISDDLWVLKEPSKKKEIMDAYHASKDQDEKTDLLNQLAENRRRMVSVSLGTNHLLYRGDYAHTRLQNGAEFGLDWNASPYKTWSLRGGIGQLATASGFKTKVSFAELNFSFRYTPFYKFTPLIQVGLGGIQNGISGDRYGKIHFGSGIEWLANKNIGLFATADYNYVFSDNLDGIVHGNYNDAYWRASLGARFYFGNKIKNTKPLPLGEKPPPPAKGPLRDF